MDPEMRRYMLELEIKKKEEEKKKKAAEERKRKEEEKKQKLAEEKRKKEELAAQAKEAKSGPQSRGSLSQASKGAENKSSLSNLDENEVNKREGKTQDSLKPQSGGSFSAGSEGYLREEPVRKGEEETMEARASRIKADILQAKKDVKGSNGNLDSRREENYDEEFEIKTPQRDAWELKKSIAEKQQKIEEVRRSVYEKGIKEDLPSYKIEESENLGGSRSNFKAQNLVGGSFQNDKNNTNIVDIAINSKGFQRKPLQKAVEHEELRNIQKTVETVAVAVDSNLGKIRQNNPAVREAVIEKTKQQMEIAMQAKRFMMEKQKAKKKHEEAAIEKKKQILNQLYNKNSTNQRAAYHEERATPIERQDEYMPEPTNHRVEEEEEEETQQQQEFRFEDSIRKSKIQGQKFGVEEHEEQNRFEDSIRKSRAQGFVEPTEQHKLESSIRNSRAYMEPVEHNHQQQQRLEDSIRNSRVQEQKKPPVEEQWESPRDQEEPEEEDDNKGQWEDGHDENEEDQEEEPYENEEEEEDQYQQDDEQEEEEDDEEEQPFSNRDNGRGYNNGNQRQYYDDPSGLAELDRPDDWNRNPQKSKEEIRQSMAQRSNQKSEWGYSRGDYEHEENEDDNPKSVMSTPYKEEPRQTPQSSAHQNQNQNDWSYDDVRQSTQSNNKKAQNQSQKYQPEEDYEKSYEEPQLSYAQMHARNKQKAQENEAYQRASNEQVPPHASFGRKNQPPVQYDPFENHQVDPHMATFGRKYVNNNNEYSDEDNDEKDYRPHNQKNPHQAAAYKKDESDDYEQEQQNQWGYKEEPKRPQGSGPRHEQAQKNINQKSYQKEESDDDYEQDQPQNQWGQKGPVYSNPMGQSIDKRSQASVRASHQSENENFVKIRDAFNDNKKQSISMEPEKPAAARGTRKWDLKRDFEAEDLTPTEKLSKGNEDYNTGSFGGDKLPRIRKQWGAQEKSESLTTSVKDLDQQQKRKTEENEEEAEMLRSYRQNQKEKKEEVKEEVVTPPAKPEKQVLLVFGDDGEDDVLKLRKQEQFLKMKQRMEQRQKDKEEKKERDRSFVRENAKERATPDIAANYSDNEDAVPSSKKPQNKFTRQSTAEKPPEKLPRIPSAKPNIPRNPSANMATRPPIDKERERFEPLDEPYSVGPSAKSNKSMAKSPGGPNNNIFQKERTPSAIGGKKGVIEFSKQSNRPLIKNAITNVCLAGEPNRKDREEVLAKLNEVTGDVNFIIVFKPITGRQDFRALYAYDTNTDEIRKICSKGGHAPDVLDANLVENYYRYNSGAKEFKHIQGNKNFSRAVDAVSLHPYLFKKATADKLQNIL